MKASDYSDYGIAQELLRARTHIPEIMAEAARRLEAYGRGGASHGQAPAGAAEVVAWRIKGTHYRSGWLDGAPTAEQIKDVLDNVTGATLEYAYAAPTAQAAPAAGAVAGPAEPTQEMIAAVLRLVDLGQSDPEDHRYDDGSKLATQICRAVIAAAPTPAAQADSQPSLTPETASAMVEGMDMNDRVLAAIDAETMADSVLEDAARGYELVGYINRGIEYHNKGKTIFHIKPTQNLKARWWTPDIAVYAARKQGGKHD